MFLAAFKLSGNNAKIYSQKIYSNTLSSALTATNFYNHFSSSVVLGNETVSQEDLANSIKASTLVRGYQVRGHRLSNLDPLELTQRRPELYPELLLETYDWSEADLNKEVFVGDESMSGVLKTPQKIKLGDLVNQMKEIYCSSVGVEYMHISSHDEQNFFRQQFEEKYFFMPVENGEKKLILSNLAKADGLEKFLALKYSQGTKRFGIDGGEALIPGMNALVNKAKAEGIDSIVFGMPHRGRLNVLANIMQKPTEKIFQEFAGGQVDESQTTDQFYSGDVKYHLGTSCSATTPHGPIHLSLVANPSHLEAADPIVEGKTLARQGALGSNSKVMAVQLHGDAAFSGQGVVYETLDLSTLKEYTTGGTIHIVVNNQIGFTTDPKSSRSSPYCTDIAKAKNIPVLHVNGDDPEAVCRVMKVAVQYRQKFQKDCVIDVVCYRKFGHNEGDNPSFTQPLMYKKISSMKSCLEKYAQKLQDEGVVPKEEFEAIKKGVKQHYEESFKNAKDFKSEEWVDSKSPWVGFKKPFQAAKMKSTGVPINTLREIAPQLANVPEGFALHRNLKKILTKRGNFGTANESEKIIDWGTAEALAFGSLLLDGHDVRLSGQDVERGTFSHRHAVLHDQNTDETYTPLSNLDNTLGKIKICNSSLSEFAVLGFETGFSMENPNCLVIWEAQFGDFANGAQIVFDQFISSAEQKWQTQSGITVLLPHGFDGQGPEHSSCRIERFLIACDDDSNVIPVDDDLEDEIQKLNWQVVNCTTPANYFHVLRRQMHREFRKPLIVVSPKNLLRHPKAVSSLDEFDDIGENTRFSTLIPELNPQDINPEKEIETLVYCSGKIYYDLLEEREKRGDKKTSLIRIEQLSPFPFVLAKQQAELYPNAKIIWAQEEPLNMGAWDYCYHRLNTVVDKKREINYVGRNPSAAPATGSAKIHQQESKQIFDSIFNK